MAWRLPDGTDVKAQAEAQSGMLRVTPPPKGGKGSYTLAWRVASADGHPIGGALVFSLGHASGQRHAANVDLAAYLAMLLRAGLVTGLVLCVGAAVYAALIGPVPPKAAGTLRKVGYAVPVLGLALIGCEGADRLGGLSFLLTPEGWLAGLTAPVAQAVLGAILAVTFVILPSGRFRTASACLAWGLAAASFAIAGHARAEPWPLMTLTFLHGAAVLFWVGGLVPLTAAVLDAEGPARAIPMRQFSKLALPIVGVLIASGLALILHRRGAPDLLDSPWARLLGVKLALVAVLLAPAALHRFRTTARMAAGKSTTAGFTLRAEIVLALLVLVLAMGFRLAPPPAFAVKHLPMTHFLQGRLMVMLKPSAIPPGLVSFDLQVTNGTVTAFTPKELSLLFSDAAAGIGPIKVKAERREGRWQTPAITLPTVGPWRVTVTVLVSDFESVKMESALRTPE